MINATDVGAVDLAAGEGTRLGRRKQFEELLHGERLVDRAVAAVSAVASTVVVVLPPGTGWDGAPVHAVVDGGADRRASVEAGVASLPTSCDVVLVHDAAHPLASATLCRACVERVADADAAVPFLDAADVVKRRNPDGSLTTVGRDGLGAAQMPMAFRRSALALHPTGLAAVEDSHLVELAGGRVLAVAGEVTNLHVTDAASLDAARRLAGRLVEETNPASHSAGEP